MGYKTNFEPYVSECCSMDIERERTSEEVLYPLLTLYPHVAALQMQSNPAALANIDHFSGYQNVGYWADAYSNPPSPTTTEAESKASSCRSSCKFSHLHQLCACEHVTNLLKVRDSISPKATKGRFVSKIRRILCREDAQKQGISPN